MSIVKLGNMLCGWCMWNLFEIFFQYWFFFFCVIYCCCVIIILGEENFYIEMISNLSEVVDLFIFLIVIINEVDMLVVMGDEGVQLFGMGIEDEIFLKGLFVVVVGLNSIICRCVCK